MSTTELYEQKYPIGRYKEPEEITKGLLEEYISVIESFPAKLRAATEHLNDQQLDTPYREEGWTIRQVVHHCADSHMNSIIRFKLALTEDRPTIKPYFEERWAELPDSRLLPVEPSLRLLEGLHHRWAFLLKALTPDQLRKTFIHPEHGKEFRLDENIGVYAWHCQHHLAHIIRLKERKAW